MPTEFYTRPFTVRDLEDILHDVYTSNVVYTPNTDATTIASLLQNSTYTPLKTKTTRRSKRCNGKPRRRRRRRKEPIYIPKTLETTNKMNKKLRLLVTQKCHNSCPMCCNKQFDFDTLPVVDRWDYEEIMFTGGEPLSSVKNVRKLITFVESIKTIQKIQGLPISKFYIYTASRHANLVYKALRYVDGIVYTPHTKEELNVLWGITMNVLNYRYRYIDKSLRLNLFEELLDMVVHDVNFEKLQRVWDIKKIEWLENCPLPEGEDFRKIHILY